MTNFQFGEAARLYGANAKIVNELSELCQKDLRRFMDALEAELGARVAPKSLQRWRTPSGYLYWYLGDSRVNGVPKVSSLYVSAADTDIAVGEVWFHGYCQNATLDRLAQLREKAAAVSGSLDIGEFALSREDDHIFTLTLRFDPKEVELGALAAPLALLLSTISED
jgi:hypothetical protein